MITIIVELIKRLISASDIKKKLVEYLRQKAADTESPIDDAAVELVAFLLEVD